MDPTNSRAAAGICMYRKIVTLRVEPFYYDIHVIMDKEAFELGKSDDQLCIQLHNTLHNISNLLALRAAKWYICI